MMSILMVALWFSSFAFLSNQCILILSILVMMIMVFVCSFINNFSLVMYLMFVLIMLSGVMVIYVYFSSLSVYTTLKMENNIVFILFFFFFFNYFKYDLSLHTYYLNNLYFSIIILLFYLLMVLFLVVKFLMSGMFSLRSS